MQIERLRTNREFIRRALWRRVLWKECRICATRP
jgi:hypothetical protein